MTQEKGIGKKKTIVAIARRLSELLYTMMKNGTEYEARKFMPEKAEAEKLAVLALSADQGRGQQGEKDFERNRVFPLTKNIGVHGVSRRSRNIIKTQCPLW
jgi:hypothetical protein